MIYIGEYLCQRSSVVSEMRQERHFFFSAVQNWRQKLILVYFLSYLMDYREQNCQILAIQAQRHASPPF